MHAALPLFVYGTLLRAEERGALLNGLERRAAFVRGRLYALPAGYPALVPGGPERAYGELVEAPPARLLQLLDAYEGVAEGLYRRVVVDVTVGLRPEPAWAYVMDDTRARKGKIVPGGRWRATRRR